MILTLSLPEYHDRGIGEAKTYPHSKKDNDTDQSFWNRRVDSVCRHNLFVVGRTDSSSWAISGASRPSIWCRSNMTSRHLIREAYNAGSRLAPRNSTKKPADSESAPRASYAAS